MDMKEHILTFADLLRGQDLSPATVKHYRTYVQHALEYPGGPLAYMGTLTGHQWGVAKGAMDWYARVTHDDELLSNLRLIFRPRKSAAKPVQIPDLETWRALGEAALRERPPFSCILWLQLYSGLRIGDLFELEPSEVVTAAETGRTTMHQKGAGHKARRDWIPGPICLRTVQYLAGLSRAVDGAYTYRMLYQLVNRQRSKAEEIVRNWIPDPWTPHTFRHSVPSYLNELGFPLEDIASITGHQSLETLRTYIHTVSPRRTVAAQEALMGLLFGEGAGG
jgi:integrase